MEEKGGAGPGAENATPAQPTTIGMSKGGRERVREGRRERWRCGWDFGQGKGGGTIPPTTEKSSTGQQCCRCSAIGHAEIRMTDMAMVRSTGCDATTSLKGFRGVFGWFSRGCRSPRKVFRVGSALKMVCVHVPDPLRNRPELPALCGPALADFPHSLVLSSTYPLPLFLPPSLSFSVTFFLERAYTQTHTHARTH